MRMHCAAMPARGHDHILNHPHEYPRERLPVFPQESITDPCRMSPLTGSDHKARLYRSSLEGHPPARSPSTPRALDADSEWHHDYSNRASFTMTL
jgi:hypothetical protein